MTNQIMASHKQLRIRISATYKNKLLKIKFYISNGEKPFTKEVKNVFIRDIINVFFKEVLLIYRRCKNEYLCPLDVNIRLNKKFMDLISIDNVDMREQFFEYVDSYYDLYSVTKRF